MLGGTAAGKGTWVARTVLPVPKPPNRYVHVVGQFDELDVRFASKTEELVARRKAKSTRLIGKLMALREEKAMSIPSPAAMMPHDASAKTMPSGTGVTSPRSKNRRARNAQPARKQHAMRKVTVAAASPRDDTVPSNDPGDALVPATLLTTSVSAFGTADDATIVDSPRHGALAGCDASSALWASNTGVDGVVSDSDVVFGAGENGATAAGERASEDEEDGDDDVGSDLSSLEEDELLQGDTAELSGAALVAAVTQCLHTGVVSAAFPSEMPRRQHDSRGPGRGSSGADGKLSTMLRRDDLSLAWIIVEGPSRTSTIIFEGLWERAAQTGRVSERLHQPTPRGAPSATATHSDTPSSDGRGAPPPLEMREGSEPVVPFPTLAVVALVREPPSSFLAAATESQRAAAAAAVTSVEANATTPPLPLPSADVVPPGSPGWRRVVVTIYRFNVEVAAASDEVAPQNVHAPGRPTPVVYVLPCVAVSFDISRYIRGARWQSAASSPRDHEPRNPDGAGYYVVDDHIQIDDLPSALHDCLVDVQASTRVAAVAQEAQAEKAAKAASSRLGRLTATLRQSLFARPSPEPTEASDAAAAARDDNEVVATAASLAAQSVDRARRGVRLWDLQFAFPASLASHLVCLDVTADRGHKAAVSAAAVTSVLPIAIAGGGAETAAAINEAVIAESTAAAVNDDDDDGTPKADGATAEAAAVSHRPPSVVLLVLGGRTTESLPALGTAADRRRPIFVLECSGGFAEEVSLMVRKVHALCPKPTSDDFKWLVGNLHPGMANLLVNGQLTVLPANAPSLTVGRLLRESARSCSPQLEHAYHLLTLFRQNEQHYRKSTVALHVTVLLLAVVTTVLCALQGIQQAVMGGPSNLHADNADTKFLYALNMFVIALPITLSLTQTLMSSLDPASKWACFRRSSELLLREIFLYRTRTRRYAYPTTTILAVDTAGDSDVESEDSSTVADVAEGGGGGNPPSSDVGTRPNGLSKFPHRGKETRSGSGGEVADGGTLTGDDPVGEWPDISPELDKALDGRDAVLDSRVHRLCQETAVVLGDHAYRFIDSSLKDTRRIRRDLCLPAPLIDGGLDDVLTEQEYIDVRLTPALSYYAEEQAFFSAAVKALQTVSYLLGALGSIIGAIALNAALDKVPIEVLVSVTTVLQSAVVRFIDVTRLESYAAQYNNTLLALRAVQLTAGLVGARAGGGARRSASNGGGGAGGMATGGDGPGGDRESLASRNELVTAVEAAITQEVERTGRILRTTGAGEKASDAAADLKAEKDAIQHQLLAMSQQAGAVVVDGVNVGVFDYNTVANALLDNGSDDARRLRESADAALSLLEGNADQALQSLISDAVSTPEKLRQQLQLMASAGVLSAAQLIWMRRSDCTSACDVLQGRLHAAAVEAGRSGHSAARAWIKQRSHEQVASVAAAVATRVNPQAVRESLEVYAQFLSFGRCDRIESFALAIAGATASMASGAASAANRILGSGLVGASQQHAARMAACAVTELPFVALVRVAFLALQATMERNVVNALSDIGVGLRGLLQSTPAASSSSSSPAGSNGSLLSPLIAADMAQDGAGAARTSSNGAATSNSSNAEEATTSLLTAIRFACRICIDDLAALVSRQDWRSLTSEEITARVGHKETSKVLSRLDNMKLRRVLKRVERFFDGGSTGAAQRLALSPLFVSGGGLAVSGYHMADVSAVLQPHAFLAYLSTSDRDGASAEDASSNGDGGDAPSTGAGTVGSKPPPSQGTVSTIADPTLEKGTAGNAAQSSQAMCVAKIALARRLVDAEMDGSLFPLHRVSLLDVAEHLDSLASVITSGNQFRSAVFASEASGARLMSDRAHVPPASATSTRTALAAENSGLTTIRSATAAELLACLPAPLFAASQRVFWCYDRDFCLAALQRCFSACTWGVAALDIMPDFLERWRPPPRIGNAAGDPAATSGTVATTLLRVLLSTSQSGGVTGRRDEDRPARPSARQTGSSVQHGDAASAAAAILAFDLVNMSPVACLSDGIPANPFALDAGRQLLCRFADLLADVAHASLGCHAAFGAVTFAPPEDSELTATARSRASATFTTGATASSPMAALQSFGERAFLSYLSDDGGDTGGAMSSAAWGASAAACVTSGKVSLPRLLLAAKERLPNSSVTALRSAFYDYPAALAATAGYGCLMTATMDFHQHLFAVLAQRFEQWVSGFAASCKLWLEESATVDTVLEQLAKAAPTTMPVDIIATARSGPQTVAVAASAAAAAFQESTLKPSWRPVASAAMWREAFVTRLLNSFSAVSDASMPFEDDPSTRQSAKTGTDGELASSPPTLYPTNPGRLLSYLATELVSGRPGGPGRRGGGVAAASSSTMTAFIKMALGDGAATQFINLCDDAEHGSDPRNSTTTTTANVTSSEGTTKTTVHGRDTSALSAPLRFSAVFAAARDTLMDPVFILVAKHASSGVALPPDRTLDTLSGDMLHYLTHMLDGVSTLAMAEGSDMFDPLAASHLRSFWACLPHPIQRQELVHCAALHLITLDIACASLALPLLRLQGKDDHHALPTVTTPLLPATFATPFGHRAARLLVSSPWQLDIVTASSTDARDRDDALLTGTSPILVGSSDSSAAAVANRLAASGRKAYNLDGALGLCHFGTATSLDGGSPALGAPAGIEPVLSLPSGLAIYDSVGLLGTRLATAAGEVSLTPMVQLLCYALASHAGDYATLCLTSAAWKRHRTRLAHDGHRVPAGTPLEFKLTGHPAVRGLLIESAAAWLAWMSSCFANVLQPYSTTAPAPSGTRNGTETAAWTLSAALLPPAVQLMAQRLDSSPVTMTATVLPASQVAPAVLSKSGAAFGEEDLSRATSGFYQKMEFFTQFQAACSLCSVVAAAADAATNADELDATVEEDPDVSPSVADFHSSSVAQREQGLQVERRANNAARSQLTATGFYRDVAYSLLVDGPDVLFSTFCSVAAHCCSLHLPDLIQQAATRCTMTFADGVVLFLDMAQDYANYLAWCQRQQMTRRAAEGPTEATMRGGATAAMSFPGLPSWLSFLRAESVASSTGNERHDTDDEDDDDREPLTVSDHVIQDAQGRSKFAAAAVQSKTSTITTSASVVVGQQPPLSPQEAQRSTAARRPLPADCWTPLAERLRGEGMGAAGAPILPVPGSITALYAALLEAFTECVVVSRNVLPVTLTSAEPYHGSLDAASFVRRQSEGGHPAASQEGHTASKDGLPVNVQAARDITSALPATAAHKANEAIGHRVDRSSSRRLHDDDATDDDGSRFFLLAFVRLLADPLLQPAEGSVHSSPLSSNATHSTQPAPPDRNDPQQRGIGSHRVVPPPWVNWVPSPVVRSYRVVAQVVPVTIRAALLGLRRFVDTAAIDDVAKLAAFVKREGASAQPAGVTVPSGTHADPEQRVVVASQCRRKRRWRDGCGRNLAWSELPQLVTVASRMLEPLLGASSPAQKPLPRGVGASGAQSSGATDPAACWSAADIFGELASVTIAYAA